MTPRLSSASSISFASTALFYANIPNPTVTITNTANNRSATAKVADRFFIAEDVPLEVGENRLRITATDHVGNTREQLLLVSRVATGSNRITILAGNRQKAGIKAELSKALEVAALDKDGNPLANMPITFDVLRGTGTIASQSGGTPANTLPKRNLVITTDAGGRAKVYLTLGKQAGEAGNMVRARNADVIEEVVFTATADKGLPTYIRATAGMSQYAATSSPVLEALTARAVDGDHNVIANVNITFAIEVGDATFSNGQKAITVTTDKSGNATTRPIMGSTAGTVIITASVDRKSVV